MDQHNTHFFAKSFTTRAKDWNIYLQIVCRDKNQAQKVEAHLKRMKSRHYLQNLKKYPKMQEDLLKRYV